MKYLAIALLIAAVSLTGCSRRAVPVSTVVSDSVITSDALMPRDSIITIAPDSVVTSFFETQLPVSPRSQIIESINTKGTRAILKVSKDSTGRISATCLCPEWEVKAKLWDRHLTTRSQKVKTEVKHVTTNHIPRLTLYLSYLGIITLILGVVWMIWRFLK